MINNLTTTNRTNLIGYIAELVCEYHFLKLNYSVNPIGTEKISELPDIDNLFKKGMTENGTYDANTFSVLQGITRFLPDFLIWKLAPNQDFYNQNISAQNLLKISFIEVKYRSKIQKRDLEISKENDVLDLYKYLNFMSKQISKQTADNLESIDKIEFYVYLITKDNKTDNHNILFGKVFEKKSKENVYKLNLYDTINSDFNKKQGNKWNEFNKMKDFLLLNNAQKLNFLFNENFIFYLKNRSQSEIKRIVFDKLDEYDL